MEDKGVVTHKFQLKKVNQSQQENRQTLRFGEDKDFFLPKEKNEEIIK